MKLVFLTNLIHHHQIPLADEFYKVLGDDYKYVITETMPDFLLRGGYNNNVIKPYLLSVADNSNNLEMVQGLVDDADVVIIGSAPETFVKKRLDNNKLTFHYSERWFKKITWRNFTPKAILNLYKNHIRYRNSESYMLCASAFTACDVNSVFCYPNKCFKWGYFTAVEDLELEKILHEKKGKLRIMWCARFIDWKHPELPILLAKRLKDKGYIFEINMYGSGEKLDDSKKLSKDLMVDDVVFFMGNIPNDEILKTMRTHNIFLFTSDKNEGWGAVLNESMANACAVVASDKIGSVPYLIKDGINGLVFESGNISSLEHKMELLFNDCFLVEQLSRAAYHTIKDEWSPSRACSSFLTLVDLIQNNKLRFDSIKYGPCSFA